MDTDAYPELVLMDGLATYLSRIAIEYSMFCEEITAINVSGFRIGVSKSKNPKLVLLFTDRSSMNNISAAIYIDRWHLDANNKTNREDQCVFQQNLILADPNLTQELHKIVQILTTYKPTNGPIILP